MYSNNPPFKITTTILDAIADIAELIGEFNTIDNLSANPILRKSNRIQTIYSSLAIEQNTLSLDQVSAVIDGKRVIAPLKDILEVKNAYEIYEMLDKLDPYSVEDLLNAHKVMTKELLSQAGCFRSNSVGVVDNHGNILHIGAIADFVPHLISDLLKWVKNSDIHMLIKSCVFHYEFELIHPFADGNGRIGRLWHTLLLTKWKPIFAWIPIESIIYNRQDEYYSAINRSNAEGESTPFIEYMLSAIKEALDESLKTNNSSTTDIRWRKIETYLKENKIISNENIRQMFNVSAATANRILAKMTEAGKLQKIRNGKSWGYIKNSNE